MTERTNAFATNAFAAAVCVFSILVMSSASAATPEDLAGDYRLTTIDINYGGSFPPPLNQGDFSSNVGYFSTTANALVFEHTGQARTTFTVYRNIVAGTYRINGSTVVVSRADGSATNVSISMPNEDTVVLAGVARDSNNASYNYVYRYRRTESYYTQEALDEAVSSATEGCFSQEDVDAAVNKALANAKPKVVPIIIGD